MASAARTALFAKYLLPSAASLALVVTGCAAAPKKPVSTPVAPLTVVLEEAAPLEASTGAMKEVQTPRRVGDVWVHRFSGSYRSAPLTLREEVIDRRDNLLTIDYVLDDGAEETHLRVQMAERSERVIAVFRVEGDEELPATVADYEQMLDKTLFLPDQNHGQLASASRTCLVGSKELDCDVTEYKVLVDEQEAKMAVSRSGEVGRDLSGEVVAVDGTILYHAQLVEMQRGESQPVVSGESVAMNDDSNYENR